jgi:hypothetical protein
MFKITIYKPKKDGEYPAEITDGKRTKKVNVSEVSKLLKLGKWKEQGKKTVKMINITEFGNVIHPAVGGKLWCVVVGKKAYALCNYMVLDMMSS